VKKEDGDGERAIGMGFWTDSDRQRSSIAAGARESIVYCNDQN